MLAREVGEQATPPERGGARPAPERRERRERRHFERRREKRVVRTEVDEPDNGAHVERVRLLLCTVRIDTSLGWIMTRP